MRFGLLKKQRKPANENVRSITTAAVELVILIILVAALMGPFAHYTDRLESKLEAKRTELQNTENLVRSVPDPQKEMDNIRKGMDELKDKSLSKEELPRIIKHLVNKSSELNIEINSIRPREDIKTHDTNLPQGVSKAYIEMIIQCSYEKLGEYLKALSGLPIIFTVENVMIQKVDIDEPLLKDKKKEHVLFATLIISTYTILKVLE